MVQMSRPLRLNMERSNRIGRGVRWPRRKKKVQGTLRRLPSFDPGAMRTKKYKPELLDILVGRGNDGGRGIERAGRRRQWAGYRGRARVRKME